MVRSTLPAASALAGPSGQFAAFNANLEKMVFSAVWRLKTAEKRSFGEKPRALIILTPLRNDFILRFQVNGVRPEEFSVKKKCRKFLLLVVHLNRCFEHPNLNLYQKWHWKNTVSWPKECNFEVAFETVSTSVDVLSTPHSLEAFFHGKAEDFGKGPAWLFSSRLPFSNKKIAIFKSKWWDFAS